MKKNRLEFANRDALMLLGVNRRQDLTPEWTKNFFSPDYQHDGSLSEERWQEVFALLAREGRWQGEWTIRNSQHRETQVWCHFRMVWWQGERHLIASLLDPTQFRSPLLFSPEQHEREYWCGGAQELANHLATLAKEKNESLSVELHLAENLNSMSELKIHNELIDKLSDLFAQAIDPTTPVMEQHLKILVDPNHGAQNFLHCLTVTASHGLHSPLFYREEFKQPSFQSLLNANGVNFVVSKSGTQTLTIKVIVPQVNGKSRALAS